MLKKTLLAVLILLVLLAAVVVGRALTLSSPQAAFSPDAPVQLPELDAEGAASRLAESLTYRTLSFPPPMPMDTATFRSLHDFLEASYPGVHSTLDRERVNGLSLLYTWPGSDPSLDPVVLMGHLDVVPVIPGTEDDWTHGPYRGVVADGFIWGRGAVDDKSSGPSTWPSAMTRRSADPGERRRSQIPLRAGRRTWRWWWTRGAPSWRISFLAFREPRPSLGWPRRGF